MLLPNKLEKLSTILVWIKMIKPIKKAFRNLKAFFIGFVFNHSFHLVCHFDEGEIFTRSSTKIGFSLRSYLWRFLVPRNDKIVANFLLQLLHSSQWPRLRIILPWLLISSQWPRLRLLAWGIEGSYRSSPPYSYRDDRNKKMGASTFSWLAHFFIVVTP